MFVWSDFPPNFLHHIIAVNLNYCRAPDLTSHVAIDGSAEPSTATWQDQLLHACHICDFESISCIYPHLEEAHEAFRRYLTHRFGLVQDLEGNINRHSKYEECN